MVRMTDLLKKAKKQLGIRKKQPSADEKQPLPPEEESGSAEVEPVEFAAPEKEQPTEKEKSPAREYVEFSEMILKGAKGESLEKEDVVHSMKTYIPTEEETRKLYLEAVDAVKIIFTTYKDGSNINKDDVMNICRKLVNNIILGSRVFLKLFHELDYPEFYTYYNAVNVSILSVEIGIAYKYNKSTLLDLAEVGLLHDMDLIKSKDIIDKPEKFEAGKIKEIRKHPLNVALYVDNAFKFSKEKVNAILQHHERKEGQGYPAGLTERDINDLAAIVGIADTYEAMTHSRPYKEKMSPHSAILAIIELGKELFPTEAVKALISRVSLYPISTWVELNTGEICKVSATNLDSPLRPIVEVLMDKDRNKFKEIRTIDLRKVPSLYITKEATQEFNVEGDNSNYERR